MRVGILIFGLVLAIITGIIQENVWNECRADGHSFFYCMALTSR